MNSRRDFLKTSGTFAAGSMLLPGLAQAYNRKTAKDIGLQLYTVRNESRVQASLRRPPTAIGAPRP